MDEHIISGIVGFATGAIASLVAPWVNWGIEKKRQKLNYKREQVAKWRKMIEEVADAQESHKNDLHSGLSHEPLWARQLLERHADFYSLQPYLSTKTRAALDGRTFLVGTTIESSLAYMVDDIARIEKKWDLI
jgi:hypothetical protein